MLITISENQEYAINSVQHLLLATLSSNNAIPAILYSPEARVSLARTLGALSLEHVLASIIVPFAMIQRNQRGEFYFEGFPLWVIDLEMFRVMSKFISQ